MKAANPTSFTVSMTSSPSSSPSSSLIFCAYTSSSVIRHSVLLPVRLPSPLQHPPCRLSIPLSLLSLTQQHPMLGVQQRMQLPLQPVRNPVPLVTLLSLPWFSPWLPVERLCGYYFLRFRAVSAASCFSRLLR